MDFDKFWKIADFLWGDRQNEDQLFGSMIGIDYLENGMDGEIEDQLIVRKICLYNSLVVKPIKSQLFEVLELN